MPANVLCVSHKLTGNRLE